MDTRMAGGMVDEGITDTEITLGVGQLLGLFFGLVILCGLALGTGYWLGRNSAKQSLAATAATAAAPASPAPTAEGKPDAAQLAPQPTSTAAPDSVQPKEGDCAGGDNCQPQAAAAAANSAPGATAPNPSIATPTDLTFYQAVQKKDNSHPQLAAPDTAAKSAPVAAADPRSTLGAGYLVQIAAVRNQDDAKLLSSALQKQQYPVIVTQPGDKLYHVQVGPYADIKEADAIRARLIGAGYNAFLKH